MKKIFVLAILCFSSAAFATKARSKALGNAMHLKGTQTVYTSPYHILDLENFVAFESGLTGATNTDNGAEGSVLFTIDKARLLFSLGHLDETVQSQRKFMNAVAGSAFLTQQNPVEFIYAIQGSSIAWAFGGYFSNHNNKVTDIKENSSGFRLSASHGDFKWKANVGLVNSATNGADAVNNQLVGDLYVNLGLRYSINKMRYGFDFTNWGVKQTNSANVENQSHTFQSYNFRAVHVEKQENGEFFFGAGLEQTNAKDKIADKKFTRLILPVIIGLETQAADWLVLRMSVTQSVLVAQSKNEAGYSAAAINGGTGVADAEFAAEGNNTTAAVGAGLTYGKVNIDGTLKGLIGSGANQNVDSGNLLAQVGLVYKY